MGTPGRFPVRENGLPKGHGGGHPACTRAAALMLSSTQHQAAPLPGDEASGAEADADARVRYCIPTRPCAAPPAPAEPAPPAKPAPTKPAPTKPAPAKPAPAKPAPSKTSTSKASTNKASTSSSSRRDCGRRGRASRGAALPSPAATVLAADSFLASEPTRGTAPPRHPAGFFLSSSLFKRALSYQNPSSRGVRYSSPAFIYWNCTASNKHTFPAAEQRRRCPQRSRGPGSTRSPLPAVRARSRALGLEGKELRHGWAPRRGHPPGSAPSGVRWAPRADRPRSCATHPMETLTPAAAPSPTASRASACERERKHRSWRRARASPAEGRALRQQGRERQPQGPTCGCFTRLAPRFTPVWICAGVGCPPTPTGGMLNPCPWDSALRFPRFPFYRHLNNKGLRSAPLGRAHSPKPVWFLLECH
ncbi:translation initiation factor IF-2-like isoform X1 [Falco biarmicus]|uniref:translation initiation factor IF-2-like isoform X1 n=1 Tax=Falco biarmicus TaxID=345155 RepID=UPI0024BD2294|nr:translation initiation factor IF-2-like isoform X1 [Falco biarmicus]